MNRKNAEWSLLTQWLAERDEPVQTITWTKLGEIVGGLPNSATDHFPQWWHGDRPHIRAWRAAGYELADVQRGQTLTLVKSSSAAKFFQDKVAKTNPSPRLNASLSHVPYDGGVALETIDRLSALIVLPCSKAKKRGGTVKSPASSSPWSSELLLARENMRDLIQLDDELVTPAWQRYTGGFYKAAGTSLGQAASVGANIAILSGGYGVVRADEEIGWYEKPLKKSDWPRGVIEEALISEAQRIGAKNVVAFAANTTDYAKIIGNTRWREAGVERAVLVTSLRKGGGAMSKIPPDLGTTFRAFWLGLSDEYPADIYCKELM